MISAVVLAAGLSRRMGQPKMVLPWGKTTIIGQVVDTLTQSGVLEIWVVTGGARQQVETALQGYPVHFVFNPDYANGEMLGSLQVGLQSLPAEVQAALLVLGDQPQMQVDTVKTVIRAYPQDPERLIVPSFQMRRGHPWLLPRNLWAEVLALEPPATLRDFLQAQTENIRYVEVDSHSIFQDLDTPEDYRQSQEY